uniref:Uncharacterized protein n=1 Tax=viral metagenome TaxID=1070528 RepID=A0A6M3LB18_9ZZZZ
MKGYCRECNGEVGAHADGSLFCSCTSVDFRKLLPVYWEDVAQLDDLRTSVIKEQIKERLYEITNLISIASTLDVNENRVLQIHEDYCRDLCEEFDHNDFVDHLVDYLDDFDEINYEEII